jgi:hypothetical protein
MPSLSRAVGINQQWWISATQRCSLKGLLPSEILPQILYHTFCFWPNFFSTVHSGSIKVIEVVNHKSRSVNLSSS